ncbi:MAG: hypothetical protein K8T90_20340 [Planctomycetes bacterium]|nr:hypothetical protein [Planctomycetota bacterium]
MKPARIAALGVAAILAGAGAWAFLRTEPAAPSNAATGTSGPAEGTWSPTGDPHRGASGNAGGNSQRPGATSVAPPPQALPSALPDVGTPVKPGQEVSVVVPWGQGQPTSFRYDIEDLNLVKYEATDYVDAIDTNWRVVLSVVDGDGKGAARIRLVVESLRVRAFGPTGVPYDEDSRSLDADKMDPGVQRVVLPAVSIVGQPLEFRIDSGGNVTDVDGADIWRERYLAEVQRIEKRAVNDAPDAWTRESIVRTWSEYLFPRIGGGTLAGGAQRPWTRSQRVGGGWGLVWSGRVEVARDDADAFRVEFVGTPLAEQIGGTPTDDADAQIAKIYAHGSDRAFVAAYRFGRSPAALIEAQIDTDFRFVSSRKTGGAPGAPAYTPEWTQRKRRVIVRRTGL